MPHSVRGRLALLACLIAAIAGRPCSAQTSAARPRLVPTVFAASDPVVAAAVVTEAPYSAASDGKSDATVAIQNAIDAVAQAGGGVVFLPAGRYLCAGDILLRQGVTLRGDYREPDPEKNQYRVGGTVLMPTAGRGDPDGQPFITLQPGAGVRNLSVWYPEQTAGQIAAYPYSIGLDQKMFGDCYEVDYVTLVNSYKGIQFGPAGNEIPTIRHVYGSPLFTGVSADAITDIPRIEHLRFSPLFWSRSGLPGSPDVAAVAAQIRDHATGIELKRCDWYFLFDVSVLGYNVGYRFTLGKLGSACGAMYDATASGGDIGVRADETALYFLFANCRFDGATAAVYGSPRFNTELQFNNCTLGGQARNAIKLDGNGIIKAQNSRIMSSAAPAVAASAGQLQLIACKYAPSGVQVDLDRAVVRALLLGGLSPAQVDNHSRGDVQIAEDIPPSLRPPTAVATLPPDKKPARNALYNVLNYGAKADGGDPQTATDNTAPFQKALDAAGQNDGGIVYVPAGSYRFAGSLRVPPGVELRGCFDIPHHTMSWGSTLMPTGGRGMEDGTPFISLEPGSGVRGMTFWYPDEKEDDITPYPWTVRALGPGCWMIDDTTANSYQYADFGTYPSDGSLLRFVSGAPLRRGVWVSKGDAEVDDGMFNGHYWLRHPAQAPPLANGDRHAAEATMMQYAKNNLDAFVFGACPATQQIDNFVFGCKHGLLFVADGGKSSAGIVINHGSDGSTQGVHIDSVAAAGLNLINTQCANVGDQSETSVEIADTVAGPVNLFNGMTWGKADLPTMLLHGNGRTTIENWGTRLQQDRVSGGSLQMQGCSWSSFVPKAVVADGPIRSLVLVGNASGKEAFAYDRPQSLAEMHNGVAVPPIPLNDSFHSGFEAADPAPDVVAFPPQGLASSRCAVVAGAGRNGSAGLVLEAAPDAPTGHDYAYFAVYSNLNITVTPKMVLRYWIRPEDKIACHSGLDLTFTTGSPLRDSGGQDTSGEPSHPAAARGVAGEWRIVEIPLGNQAGRVINQIVFGFDASDISASARTAVDNIEIGEPAP